AGSKTLRSDLHIHLGSIEKIMMLLWKHNDTFYLLRILRKLIYNMILIESFGAKIYFMEDVSLAFRLRAQQVRLIRKKTQLHSCFPWDYIPGISHVAFLFSIVSEF
ncbi:hypothetical protein ACJX0J_006825, partial [Zea mays]